MAQWGVPWLSFCFIDPKSGGEESVNPETRIGADQREGKKKKSSTLHPNSLLFLASKGAAYKTENFQTITTLLQPSIPDKLWACFHLIQPMSGEESGFPVS